MIMKLKTNSKKSAGAGMNSYVLPLLLRLLVSMPGRGSALRLRSDTFLAAAVQRAAHVHARAQPIPFAKAEGDGIRIEPLHIPRYTSEERISG